MTAAAITALDQRFRLGEHLHVGESSGHAIVAIATSDCMAEIALQGAQVLRWQPKGQADVLWCAPLPVAGSGKAMRGGIPVCWPWFGPHATDANQPQHGLVRTVAWDLVETAVTANGIRVVLAHDSSGCALRLEIEAGAKLSVALAARNLSTAPVVITEALHTYFQVGDVSRIAIHGLDGCQYRDNTDSGCEKIQHGNVSINSETVALFDAAPGNCTIDDPSLNRRISITRTGGRSTIIWNPGAAASKISDLPAGEQQHFICVESGNIGTAAVCIAPGETHRLAVTYEVLAP